MKRLAAIGSVVIFVVGVLVVPGLHQVDGCPGDCCESSHSEPSSADRQHDNERAPSSPARDDGHDSDNCALCKLAATATMAADSSIEVVQIVREAEDLCTSHPVVVPHSVVRLSLARAPPFSSHIGRDLAE